MLIKILLIVAVVAFIYFIFIKKKPLTQKKDAKDKEQLSSSDMVECAGCGIYTEVGDAILSGGKYYCSKECQQRG